MTYKTELDKAMTLEREGKSIEAAKLFEEVGTKMLREGTDEEKKQAAKIIGKSIARYLLADKTTKAQDLAFQVLFMKDSDPFLSLQVESAITAKKQLVRGFIVDKIPEELSEDNEVLNGIPQTRKITKINSEVTIKELWEGSIFGPFIRKYDLVNQTYTNPKEMINFILSTKTGVLVVGAEATNGKKMLVLIAVTFNKDPVEVLEPKQV